ncbi:MAG: DNA polymerase III subunit beta [Patescibacteria group bacterium]|nr:DNA polymerase III subunit beta [Patescibacteria group bacterium]
MKLVCTKENLSRALNLVNGVVNKNPNLPILGNILIKALNQKVEIIATNLEIAITANLRAKIEKEGSFTVPSRTLFDLVNLLSDEKVEMELEGSELKIICGKTATKIKGSPADEFPVVPAVSGEKGFLIDAQNLKRGLEQVVFASAKNEIRPELSGVFFNFNRDDYKGLVLAATDSYRLAEKKLALAQGQDSLKVIVPFRAAQEIIHIISVSGGSESEKNFRLLVSDNQLVARFDDVEMVSRLVEGQYPDYTQIIPKDFLTVAEMPVAKTIKEIKAASLFTTIGINAVLFNIKSSEGIVCFSSTSTQTGEHKSEINTEIKGPDNSILLNHRYVLDGLGNIDDETMMFKVINGENPCIFAPKNNNDYLYIVMPVRQ